MKTDFLDSLPVFLFVIFGVSAAIVALALYFQP